jgi:hypothetical protein
MNNQGHKRDQNQAREAASSAVEKAKDTASGLMDKARDAASNVGQAASNMASTVGQKAESATASVGGGMRSLGETVREKGPESGFLGSATKSVAGALENTGSYLEEKNLSGMADDLTNLIRRNPIPALLIGVGLGFLLARTMRS